MTAVKKPWAILLCKFSDDQNDPSTTRVMDLVESAERPGLRNGKLGAFLGYGHSNHS
jgi:hypothetical protein